MIHLSVELSGESLPLAVAELDGACEALGGRSRAPLEPVPPDRTVEVDLPDAHAARALVSRLAFARRLIEFRGTVPAPPSSWWEELARTGASAAIRWVGHERRGGNDPTIASLAKRWASSGGRIDLDHPDRRFWLRSDAAGSVELGEEIGAVDRGGLLSRRMSRLPFRRPISLDPRLARATVNLARVRRGDRVIDPFVGTGALLAEAALLGGHVVGIDVDLAMIRGAARNFEHLGVQAEAWIGGDAQEASSNPIAKGTFDAMVTDVPYGRSSGTQGEAVEQLVRRVLPVWAERVRPEGFVVIVSAGNVEPLDKPWARVRSVAVRQHRSLTRVFSVYHREAAVA